MQIDTPWINAATKLGACISGAASVYPELMPLHTAWINFAHKYGISITQLDSVNNLKQVIKRQQEEISALEYRIATLLGDKS